MLIILVIVTALFGAKLVDEKIERLLPASLSGMTVLLYVLRRLDFSEYYAFFIVVPVLAVVFLFMFRKRKIVSTMRNLKAPGMVALIISIIGLHVFYMLVDTDLNLHFYSNALSLGYMIIFSDSQRHGRFKSLVTAVFFSAVILIAASDNWLTGDSRYVLAGVIIACWILSAWQYYAFRKRPFLYFTLIHTMAIFTMGRMCILLFALLSASAALFLFGDYIDRKLLKSYLAKAIALAVVACLGILVISMLGNRLIYSNDFVRDVLNSYLGAVFTTRRFSFGFLFNIPFSYFVIISLFVYVLADICFAVKKTTLFWIINLGIILFTFILGGLYLGILARVNIQNGEYLTGFENYIQMPVVMLLVFWGCFINGFFSEGLNS